MQVYLSRRRNSNFGQKSRWIAWEEKPTAYQPNVQDLFQVTLSFNVQLFASKRRMAAYSFHGKTRLLIPENRWILDTIYDSWRHRPSPANKGPDLRDCENANSIFKIFDCPLIIYVLGTFYVNLHSVRLKKNQAEVRRDQSECLWNVFFRKSEIGKCYRAIQRFATLW